MGATVAFASEVGLNGRPRGRCSACWRNAWIEYICGKVKYVPSFYYNRMKDTSKTCRVSRRYRISRMCLKFPNIDPLVISQRYH